VVKFLRKYLADYVIFATFATGILKHIKNKEYE
jgi:hypothetical protein